METKKRKRVPVKTPSKRFAKPMVLAPSSTAVGWTKQTLCLPTPEGPQPSGAWLWYGFLHDLEPSLVLTKETWEVLRADRPTERPETKIFNKVGHQNHYSRSYGVPYTFAGVEHEPVPLTSPFLLRLQAWASRDSGKTMNQVLVNWYPNGSFDIKPHSDKEKQLDPTAPIYSFSFGATRRFMLRPTCATSKRTRDTVDRSVSMDYAMDLVDKMVLVMGGTCQRDFKHWVPVDRK